MPTKTGKTVSSYYGNDLTIDQATNTGVDTTTRKVQDGFGNNTSCSLSDDVLSVQPVNDDTTGAMLVKNSGGSNILAVDTTNSVVKAGASQLNVLTYFQFFGLHDAQSAVAGTHYMMPRSGFLHSTTGSASAPQANGTGTNPGTSLTLSADFEMYIISYWFVPFNITIDEVRLLARAANDTTMNFHVMSFDVVTGTGATSGNLSNGVYNCTSGTTDPNSLSPITVTDENLAITTLTIENADIDSGKVVLAHFENVGTTDKVSAQLIIKYHAR